MKMHMHMQSIWGGCRGGECCTNRIEHADKIERAKTKDIASGEREREIGGQEERRKP